MKKLQQTLNLAGQSIPSIPIDQSLNLALKAYISASGTLSLDTIPFDGDWYRLDFSAAQLLPFEADKNYTFEIEADAEEITILDVELRYSSKTTNYTPDRTAESKSIKLEKGNQKVLIKFAKGLPNEQYGFITFLKNDKVKIKTSNFRSTGILSVFNKFNHDVNNYGKQEAPANSGIESFEFWCPERRPKGYNFAMKISPTIESFGTENLLNGFIRPTNKANAWVAPLGEKSSTVKIKWDSTEKLKNIILYFDNDYDHALESVQMGHPENIMPFCIREYKILDDKGQIIYAVNDNHQTINNIQLPEEIKTKSITLEVKSPLENVPASIFGIYIS